MGFREYVFGEVKYRFSWFKKGFGYSVFFGEINSRGFLIFVFSFRVLLVFRIKFVLICFIFWIFFSWYIKYSEFKG